MINYQIRNKVQFESYVKSSQKIFYIHTAFPLLFYALLKRYNLPCMKILSDSCNGI